MGPSNIRNSVGRRFFNRKSGPKEISKRWRNWKEKSLRTKDKVGVCLRLLR